MSASSLSEEPLEPEGALAFVAQHGVVLESARGPAPTLAEAIAGGLIRGSWWPHPRSHAIFDAINLIRAAPEVHTCRLVDGKVTYVHRRLWPALIRLRGRFDDERLAAVLEEHTESGAHRVTTSPFLSRVPLEAIYAADRLSEAEATIALEAAAPYLLR